MGTHEYPSSTVQPSSVWSALETFLTWLGTYGYTSYDQYDFWGTKYGIWAKDLYYRFGRPMAPFVAPLVLFDWIFPASRKIVCKKQRFPIADAHYLMGFVVLYKITGNKLCLDEATKLADQLLSSSISGYSGHCWGYPFDWQTKRGLCRKGTPLVTTTPYVFDAFLDLFEVTREEKYLLTARSIANFVAKDILHMPVGRGRAASYTPHDYAQVVNASAYKAACMARASQAFSDSDYRRIAIENAYFVADQQQPDGSWPYSANDPHDAFVDHFHTCFVLKGLYRTFCVVQDEQFLNVVKKGYDYYRKELFYRNCRPKPFSKTGPAQFRVIELYDYAEAINLLLLIRQDIDTGNLADVLLLDLLENWQTTKGYFVTRISTGKIRNRTPYHRWAQSQVFHALAFYYSRMDNRS
jgi:uncharacterized protein YyaL (SSP411 family)